MKNRLRKTVFTLDNGYVSLGEILFSIIFVILFCTLGIVVTSIVSDTLEEYNESVRKSAKLKTVEMFVYGKNTHVGDAYTIANIDSYAPVTLEELRKEYMYIEQVFEHNTEHTRVVSTGKTSRIEHYYTWDETKTDIYNDDIVLFNGVEVSFDDVGNLDLCKDTLKLSEDNIFGYKTKRISENYVYIDSDDRYYYKVIPKSLSGAATVSLQDGEVDNIRYSDAVDVDTLVKRDTANSTGICILLWGILLILCGFVVYMFVGRENEWLE